MEPSILHEAGLRYRELVKHGIHNACHARSAAHDGRSTHARTPLARIAPNKQTAQRKPHATVSQSVVQMFGSSPCNPFRFD